MNDGSGTMTSVAGSWSYEVSATGYEHGTVLRFVPGTSIAAGTAVQLNVNAGGLVDSWANGTTAATLNFNMGTGVLYTGPPQGNTSTPVVERSLVGNGLLFQAHLWDADAGLYLARARVLDPTTGTFLSRDRLGFRDSVNLYAFSANDPVNHRDPTGNGWDPEEPPVGAPAGAPGAVPENESVYTSGGTINYGSRAAHANFSAAEQFNLDKLRFQSNLRETRRSRWFSWFSSPAIEQSAQPPMPAPAPPRSPLATQPPPRLQPPPQNQALAGSATAPNTAMSGPVRFRIPANATPEQVAQYRAYVAGCNEARAAGALSPTGRVSTKGSLRMDASLAAAAERNAAAASGTPYQGHAGHVPDTTWTGKPVPYRWLDLDPAVNTSLGGQCRKYPVGYKPTGFEIEEW